MGKAKVNTSIVYVWGHDLRQQSSDSILRVWVPYVRKPREYLPLTPLHLFFVRNFDKFVIIYNIIYRQIIIEQKKKYQFVMAS